MLETLNQNNPEAIESPNEGGVTISETERQEVSKLMKKFYQYKKYRTRYDKRWMDYYKFFRGEHWSDRRPRWKSSEVINLVWQVIQSQIPLQTDVRPKFSFLPTEPSDLQFSNVLEKVADSDWEKNGWMSVVLEVLYDAWIYGTGHSSMRYDPTANYGIGSASFKSEDPFYCYPCPDSNNINDSESEGFFYARPIATERLKQKYPKRGDQIRSDVVDFARKERTNLQTYSTTYFNSDRQMPEGNYGGSWEGEDIPRTFVIEGFLKPNTLVEDENDVEENGAMKKSYTVRKKYPNGRHVVIANNMLLLDEELPYDDNLIPFSKMINYALPREYFGVSEVEQLEGPQRIFNKFLCFALDAWALTGNPVWICDTNAGLDTDEGIVNVPGSIIEKNPGTEVRQVPGVGMNPALMPLLDRLVGWFNSVAGQSSDLSQGDAPGGVTAASAIEQLVRIARTRVRQKQRNLDLWLSDVGRQYMNRVFQFYDVPKVYRITNDDNTKTFMRFRMDKNEKGERVAVKSNFVENQMTGKTVEGPEETLIVKGNFDISVKTGSDLPFEQGDIERKALALFDRRIIDAEEVLERLEIPNRDRILTRMMERQQQAAQAQQKGGQ